MSLEPCAISAASPRLQPRNIAVESTPGTVRILKFGGSSVGTPDRIVSVGRIVLDAAASAPGVVVVSAFQGVTNDLLECARQAERECQPGNAGSRQLPRATAPLWNTLWSRRTSPASRRASNSSCPT